MLKENATTLNWLLKLARFIKCGKSPDWRCEFPNSLAKFPQPRPSGMQLPIKAHPSEEAPLEIALDTWTPFLSVNITKDMFSTMTSKQCNYNSAFSRKTALWTRRCYKLDFHHQLRKDMAIWSIRISNIEKYPFKNIASLFVILTVSFRMSLTASIAMQRQIDWHGLRSKHKIDNFIK